MEETVVIDGSTATTESAVKYKSVLTPRQVEIAEGRGSDRYAKFVVEPLERGYGDTLGSALRRVLLSSIQGTALVRVRLEGVLQEVSYIPGVVEDVTEIIFNLSSIIFRLHRNQQTTVNLSVVGPKEVTAADIQPHQDVDILNPDQRIAKLEDGGVLEIEMVIDRGIGYVPAEANRLDSQDIYTIPVDSVFTPIRRVKYRVEHTRVGEVTDYDRLVLEIWTNGTIRPEEALTYTGKTLRDHLALFVTFEDAPKMLEADAPAPEVPLNAHLLKSVDEMELSVRSYNCLKAANIKTIAELVQKTEQDMLKYRNFGKKSLVEIRELLDRMDLRLGMELSEDEQARLGMLGDNQGGENS